jgi:hypothetical protein
LGQGNVLLASFSFDAVDPAFDPSCLHVYFVGLFQEPLFNDGKHRRLFVAFLSSFKEDWFRLQSSGVRFLLPALLSPLAAFDYHEPFEGLFTSEDGKR